MEKAAFVDEKVFQTLKDFVESDDDPRSLFNVPLKHEATGFIYFFNLREWYVRVKGEELVLYTWQGRAILFALGEEITVADKEFIKSSDYCGILTIYVDEGREEVDFISFDNVIGKIEHYLALASS